MAEPRVFPLEFERQRPVQFYPEQPGRIEADILEIGPGRGDLLFWLARSFPAKQFLAVELGGLRFRKLCERRDQRGLTNITLMRGLAQILVTNQLAELRLERIYVLFPDPWPKERHSFHRLLTAECLQGLANILRPGADIVLGTDAQFYADWVLENVKQVPSLSAPGDPYWNGDYLIPSGEATYFEKKWKQQGRDIYWVRLIKQ